MEGIPQHHPFGQGSERERETESEPAGNQGPCKAKAGRRERVGGILLDALDRIYSKTMFLNSSDSKLKADNG